ncbi:60S ribosomal L21-1-like [Olea europaea subsp. europaea]|uniref:60S ribosomal L21-1-like n=1 Tax=Olea europaea subsp. europaea TaxID=158383 RepID=A0A8S0P9B1_OLEEU|nr:60S ribosomal L21-1-like [Olea europaea subsp. europaea]
MLLDQRILIEMRLRTVKLETIQHVTEEFARLRDFISSLVFPSGGTSTFVAAPVVNEPNIWDDPHEDGEGSDERSPQDDDHTEEGETVPTLPKDDNEEAPSTHDVTEVDGTATELMMKSTDKMKAEAKSRGVVISTKKQPKGPKSGFMPEGSTMETITPIPYDVINDIKGSY